MGQIEVFELMKNLRETGDDAHHSVKDVEEMLKAKGFTNGVLQGVRGDLLRLEMSGYFEVVMSGKVHDWKRLFRIKKKYLNK